MRVVIWRKWPGRLQGVRILALDPDGRLLLVRHSYGSDKWMPPGGGLGRAEDPLTAAVREMMEETGCVLTDSRLVTVSEEDLHGSQNGVHVVVGSTQGVPRPDGREILEAEFFSLDALPDYMPHGLADQLREWLSPHRHDGTGF